MAERVDRLLNLEAVRRQAVLDVPGDGALAPVAELARRMIGCQAAVIDIVDRERLFQMSRPNEADASDQEVRFASIAIDVNASPVSANSFEPRDAANAARAGELGFGFYAGVPLRTADGHMLGTLALVDPEPRIIEDNELDSLKLLASVVVDMLELRLAARTGIAAASCQLS